MRCFSTFLMLLPLFASAQDLVSQAPLNRTVLLEEYTAINCGNCPAAHVVAGTIETSHPAAVIGVEVHGGSLSVPSGGQPDLRSVEGSALWSQYGVNFQPQGMVNRQGLQAAAQWTGAVNTALATSSPVNVGMAASFDQGSRLLTVDVELYYTADGTGGTDRICVLLTEDHIVGYQQDYANGAQPNYDHRHALRSYLTPLAGDEVTPTTAGSSTVRTYTFTVPEIWNIDQCAAVAFIGEQSVGSAPGVVYQVASVDASGGATTGINTPYQERLGTAFPVPAALVVYIPFAPAMDIDVLLLRDPFGRVVREEHVAMGQQGLLLDVSGLASGIYFYGFSSGAAKPLIVRH
ncbi:MAG: Omp28-related outer membrane protein [Flavobacteriales bacterium]